MIKVGNTSSNEILQENHYYPFGMAMNGPWMDDPARNMPYQYNGKELNEDFGLGLYDYRARWYDASVGRWWSIDPLGEIHFASSGYGYVRNSPILHFDWMGLTDRSVVDDSSTESIEVTQSQYNYFLRMTSFDVGNFTVSGSGGIIGNTMQQPQQPPGTFEYFSQTAQTLHKGESIFLHTGALFYEHVEYQWANNHIQDFIRVLRSDYTKTEKITLYIEIQVNSTFEYFGPFSGKNYQKSLDAEFRNSSSYPEEIREQIKKQIGGWNNFVGGTVSRPDFTEYTRTKDLIIRRLKEMGVEEGANYEFKFHGRLDSAGQAWLYVKERSGA